MASIFFDFPDFLGARVVSSVSESNSNVRVIVPPPESDSSVD